MLISKTTQLDFLAPTRDVRWEEVDAKPGTTVGDLVPDCETRVVATVNGKRVENDLVLEAGDFVSYMVLPGDPKAIIGFFIQMAATYLLIKWLMPDMPEIALDDDTTYGFTGSPGNRYGEGFGMPVVYGECRTGGVVIGQFSNVRYIESGLEAVSLYAMSDGPVVSVAGHVVSGQETPATGLMINGNAGGSYYGYGVEVSLGGVNGWVPTYYFGQASFTTVTVDQELQKPATDLTKQTFTGNTFTVGDPGVITVADQYVEFGSGGTLEISRPRRHSLPTT